MPTLFQRVRHHSLMLTLAFAVLIGALLSVLRPVQAASSTTTDQTEFFEKNIRPVLSEKCFKCHSSSEHSSGRLRLDSRAAVLKGGRTGPAVVPGNPAASLLIARVTSKDEDHRMPQDSDPLSTAEIDNLRTWIQNGVYWPENHAADTSSTAPAAVPGPTLGSDAEFFVKRVKPIFAEHCYACHAADTKPAAGLRVDTSLGLQTGGRSGALFNISNPEQSLLLKKVTEADPKKRMPKDSDALTGAEIATLREWIAKGAKLQDETEKVAPMSAAIAAKYDKERREHWAFRPIAHPAPPAVKNARWPEGNLDRFILAKLENKNLAPVRDADPETLLRRLRFDLTGLPATPKEVADFHAHHNQRDYEALVDHLLASRQFAERWGRHWLDVARYGESTGPSRNVPYPHAWRYRDYVIDSVAQDVPYDRFLTEQIAGDLLPAKTAAERDRLAIATGFLAIGVKDVNQRFPARFQMDNVDEQIDTISRSTMALTVSCARCHDHKFDPIPQRDYYALAGILTSTADYSGVRSLMGGAGLAYYDPKHLLLLSSAPKPAADSEDVKLLQDEIDANTQAIQQLAKANSNPDQAVKVKLASLNRTAERLKEQRLDLLDPATLGYGVHGVAEGNPADTSVRVRGVEERHGPTVPRGFLTAFTVPGAIPVNQKQSGRLELAEWITSPENPLTARVAVNRIWADLFGRGIVSTVDNFGNRGDVPSNPELLDYLAAEFVQNGWSQKKLVREIVLSHTYRLSAANNPRGAQDDPADRLLWRHLPRRLEAEEVRDSILRASGQLDEREPQGSSSMNLRMVEIGATGAVAKSIFDEADRSTNRSIYLSAVRDIVPRSLAAFDPVTQTLVTGQRNVTTVPTQALFLLNSGFVRKQALAQAELLERIADSDEDRIRIAYLRTLNRTPSKEEHAKALSFLSNYASTWEQAGADLAAKDAASKDFLVPGVLDTNPSKPPFEVGDQLQQNHLIFNEPEISYASSKEAALAAFVQVLYASAEFQYIR